MQTKERVNVYQVITDRILELLEQGTVPWHKPWGGPGRIPKSLVTGKPYRGVNLFILGSSGFGSPYWLSFKQAQERGGHVRKGEKSFPCVYWNWIEKTNPEKEKVEKIPFLRYYRIFNVQQCENVEYPQPAEPNKDFQPLKQCESVVEAMPKCPEIRHGMNRAAYSPFSDRIEIPKPEWFDNTEEYYCTLFHELVHSTGHESRLHRTSLDGTIIFGSNTYSKEELVAEMGATYLCGHTGIERKILDNSAAYISSWLHRLKSDHKLVVQAAAHAQKAADYILRANYSEIALSNEAEAGQ